jgi:hypothetical protein
MHRGGGRGPLEGSGRWVEVARLGTIHANALLASDTIIVGGLLGFWRAPALAVGIIDVVGAGEPSEGGGKDIFEGA